MEQSTKDALKVQALRERLAQLVAQYEDQIADIRAEYTYTVESLSAEIHRLQNIAEGASDEVSPDEDSSSEE